MSTRTEPSPPKRSRANTDGDAGKKVQNRCAETGESIASVQWSVLKCINKRLLRSFSEFELHIPVEQMTEERLVAAIENILGSVINDTIPDVMGLMARHLKMDLTQKDVKARILDYFDSMEEVIEVHGLGVSLRNNVKLKCKVLVENLRPATLKDQQAFDLYPRTDKRDQSNRDSKIQAKKLNHTGTHNRGGDQRRPAKPPRKKREGLPPGSCLYCRKSDHWLEDCPTATENQKKKAMKSFLDNKRRDRETTTLKRLVTGGYIDVREVVFNDLVAMPYYLDNGTTHNIIPRSMVEELQLLDSSGDLKQLEPPVRGKAVGEAYITCTEYVELDIGLQTVAGRVNIRGLTCIITETDED
ncbi:unnamed protein product [Phytophthora lilii]|uniref:Unnamed protein product n=1 Tax=Phytophthora lilii TaxID=2077276 RepID=A0A9W6U5F6_9STRA|nr:unnamed protein product [Phytophthora lilii]